MLAVYYDASGPLQKAGPTAKTMSEAARMASLAENETQRQNETGADAGFLWDFWYPALRSDEIRGKNVATALLWKMPLVLGRTSDGRAFAMRDSCPHRGIPLSY